MPPITSPARALIILLVALSVAAPPAHAADAKTDNKTDNGAKTLTDISRVMAHVRAFQRIADAHGGNRATGSPGFAASFDYVADRLREAGYNIETQDITFARTRRVGDPTLAQPDGETFREGADFRMLANTAPGDVTAAVAPIDIATFFRSASTSGCQESDFDDFPSGAIALTQRGGCSFAVKANNAAAAGAVGAIIFNQGDTEERKEIFSGNLSMNFNGAIPVFSTRYDLGVAWSDAPELRLRMVARVERETITAQNLLAETSEGRGGSVVMAGAHLDSVQDGPGIQDNATGAAALLAIAEAVSANEIAPRNKIRFAWWAAEEDGLIGSRAYVRESSAQTIAGVALYLNFDMIGSPNFVRYVMDGDGSAGGAVAPDGSDDIERALLTHFQSRGLVAEQHPLELQSDYAPFLNAGVPVGGVFAGAEMKKTPEQQARYGGEVGAPMDPCYHSACDTIDNVNFDVLAQMTTAAESAILDFARRPLIPRARR